MKIIAFAIARKLNSAMPLYRIGNLHVAGVHGIYGACIQQPNVSLVRAYKGLNPNQKLVLNFYTELVETLS